MNQVDLARQARADAAKFSGILAGDLVHKLELAYIALWLDLQDHSVRENAANTACGAIEFLRLQRINGAQGQ